MMALLIATAVVVVERYINRRRLRLYEVLLDVGWLTLLFALIQLAYLMVVETLTLNYGSAVRPLWYTETPIFKGLLLEAAVAVLLILTSVWLDAAGIRVELRRPRLATAVMRGKLPPWETPKVTAGTKAEDTAGTARKKCDIEWREAA